MSCTTLVLEAAAISGAKLHLAAAGRSGLLTKLAPDPRQVCLLRDILQYTTQEVADRLGISAMAVRLRLFRAHRKLHEALRTVLRRNKRQSAMGRQTAKRAARPGAEKFLRLRAMPECACGD